MSQESRLELLDDLQSGRISPAEMIGISEEELRSIEQLAIAQYDAGRFAESARLFAGLESLAPREPTHTLNRARSEAKAGDLEAAIASVSKIIEDGEHPAEEIVRALIFRAMVFAPRTPERARQDLAVAKIVADGFPEAKRLLDEVLK
jgi:hypothetical protein